MIAKMSKVYVAARRTDNDSLLSALGRLGAVHLMPVDSARATADEKTVAAIDRLDRAMQILNIVVRSGQKPDIDPIDAATEVIRIQRDSAERRSRLSRLHRQLEQLAVWGDVRLEQFDQLRDAGVSVSFFSVKPDEVPQIQAELAHVLQELPAKRLLVVAINRDEQAKLPESAQEVPLPETDRPAIRAEAARVDAELKRDAARLGTLANLLDQMQASRNELSRQANWTIAHRGGLAEENLYAVQGWIPADRAETLGDYLADCGIDAAVQVRPPTPDEEPPTLIRYPRWAQTIKGLFEILGTLPGYREIDLSPFFMVALPLFAAILIGDAGYGLIFLAVPLIFYRKLVAKAGPAKTHLLVTIGVATMIWGVLSANYFGITPETMAFAGQHTKLTDGKTIADYEAMAQADDGWSAIGRAMMTISFVWRADPEEGRSLLMKIAFVIGAIHLTLAQLRRAAALLPLPAALAPIGWAVFLWGMLGLIWYLMFIGVDKTNWSVIAPLLGVGYILVLLFSSPRPNFLKRIGLGFAGSLLPALGAFSDTMSYVRLMAVGLASYYIAAAFNGLGATLADTATWLAAAPVIAVGHLLNIGLAIIAIFAHGVRLNMLEFSNNAGVQWAGYAYQPFAGEQKIKES